MGTFEIQRSTRLPSVVPLPRANMDVDTGAGDIGQAITGLGQTLKLINDKREQMTDANSAVEADGIRALADQEFESYKLTNPQDTWVEFRQKQATDVSTKISQLKFSKDALSREMAKTQTYAKIGTASALTDATRQLRTDTIDAQYGAMVKSFRTNDEIKIKEATDRYIANGNNMGKDGNEVLADIEKARSDGKKLQIEDIKESVAGSIEQMNGMPESDQLEMANQLVNELTNDKTDRVEIKKYAKSVVLLQSDEIATNEVVRDKLHTDITNVWRGAESKSDVNQKLLDARQGVQSGNKIVYKYGNIESDRPLISKEDYKSLSDKADMNLKSSQAEDLSRFDKEGREQLVEYGSDLQFAEVLKIIGLDSTEGKAAQDKRKLQLWYLSRYNQDLAEWISANPDKSSKDFYIFSKSLLHTYRQSASDLDKIERLQNEEFNIELSVPNGFDDVWDELDNDKRLKVQSAIKNGYPTDKIKEAL